MPHQVSCASRGGVYGRQVRPRRARRQISGPATASSAQNQLQGMTPSPFTHLPDLGRREWARSAPWMGLPFGVSLTASLG